MKTEPLTVVEISKKNLVNNLTEFRKMVGWKKKIMAVVKANAYGHGILEVAKIVSKNGADWLGVASIEEGLLLRQQKIDLPILVLGYIPLSEVEEAIRNNLSFVVYNRQVLKKLNEKAKIHLKIETGTNRQGISLKEIIPFVKLCQKRNIFIEGIYTHFANVEDASDPGFTMQQLFRFKRALQLIKKTGVEISLKHIACSAAAILYPQTHFDLIRLGISLYGFWPSKETKISFHRPLNLKPVLSWKTKIAQIKEVQKGESVGYGRTWWATRKSRIAILPVGYWDGYDRKLSNSGRVLIHGQFAPVVGRVCMNMIMVDITDIPKVKVEEEVVLLGKQGKNEITAEDLAEKIGTIHYEVVTRINPLLPRKVV